MSRRFSVESVFRAVDRVTAPVSRMQQRVSRFTRGMSRGMRTVGRAADRMRGKITRAGKVGATALAGMALSLSVLAGAGLDFEQAITNVGAVALKTRAEIAPLEKMAKDLGATTKFTATEAANAMEILARAGFNTQQILKATPAVLSAAAASGLEIAEVANHVSNVLKGMGLDMDQAARVADVLALASARTNSTIGTLGESMKNAAATARKLGVPLEDVVASVALLQDVGLDASVAGSAVNVMLTKMATPSAKVQKIMRRLNISFADAKGNMKSLPTVISDISKASKAMGGNFNQVAFLAELVGLRGQKAASNLADLFDTGKLQSLTEELRNAKGAADKMANLRMDTTRGSLALLGSAVDAVKVQLFDMNSGPLKDTIDSMTKWVGANQELIATKVSEFIDNLIENLPTIWKWMKRIGVAVAVFYALSAALNTLIAVLTIVNLVMAANPIVLIVLAVVAAVAALTALVIWVDEVAAAFDNLSPFVRGLLLPLELVVRAIKFIKDAFTGGFGNAVSNLKFALGFSSEDDTEQAGNTGAPQMISPSERTARSIEESRTTSTSEVTIRDETNRAEVTKGALGAGITLQPSGGF